MLAQEVAHCCLSIEQTHRTVPLVRIQNLLYSLIGSPYYWKTELIILKFHSYHFGSIQRNNRYILLASWKVTEYKNMEIPICPHCRLRVIPKSNGACPNCGRIIASDINAPSSILIGAAPVKKISRSPVAGGRKKTGRKPSLKRK